VKPYEILCKAADRGAWLEARSAGIGGSDAAAVLGLNPWRSPLAVYAEKVTGKVDSAENEAMAWGTKLEPIVLAHFGAVTNRIVRPAQELLRSRTDPHMLATLDGWQETERGEGGVEIKCTGLAERWEDGPPPYVMAQVQHQLHVTGYEYASIAALFNGKQFQYWDVERDEPFIRHMVEVETEFWGRVEMRDPPEAGPTWADKEALSLLYPKETGTTVEIGVPGAEIDAALETLRLTEKKLKLEILAAENQLKALIGKASFAVLPTGVSYSYLTQSREAYEVKANSFRVLRRRKAK
jgi:putative phage-type endonuclease